MRAWGVKSRMCPPYPQRDRKRRLNGAVCRNHRIKRVVRVGARTGTLKNPTKCLWRWEPDRRSNFFFSPPAHLCAVTYMTEISLIVTLNNQFNNNNNNLHPNFNYWTLFVSGTELYIITDRQTDRQTNGQMILLLDAPDRPFRPWA